MLVALYTSRVVLNTLGVEDYGIYNVVGGVVSMFAFINWAMSSATQRFITFALGDGNIKKMQVVFSTALQIHVLIGFVIIILGESVGLWFLYNKMQIPLEREVAAFWVLQFSIILGFVGIVSVPYNADIIAHEKMSVFAYISILEAVLKLVIVYCLLFFSYDKLILYAFLLMAVQVLIRFCYSSYCHKYFKETIYCHVWDKELFKEMTNFAGWSLIGNLAAVLFGQGLNMLLNVFFGPVVNAARAVAVQVQSTVQQFVSNFQTAINPQITKSFAQGDLISMHKLMYRSARLSFFVLFFLSLPVFFETDFILAIWLETVPENTVVFLRIMLCTSLMYTLSNPLMIANQSTGKIKKYQIVCGSILLLILPVSYVFLLLGFPPCIVFIIHLVMECLAQLARMIMLRPLIGVRVRDYFYNIYMRGMVVVIVSLILPSLFYFNIDESVFRFFSVSVTCAISVLSSAYMMGLSSSERFFLKEKIFEFICKLKG